MKKRIYFNFSAYRSLENVVKMYDVINSKGRKKSEFVKKAYLVYKQNQDIPKKTMNMVNNINLLKYIANKYNIKENDQETIRKILEKTNFSEGKQLPEMNSGRMTLSFAADDEIGNELCDLFEKTDNIDKVFKLVDIVSYYVESGRDKDYLEKESEELLKNLAAFYDYAKTNKTIAQIAKTFDVSFNAELIPSYSKTVNDNSEIENMIGEMFSG